MFIFGKGLSGSDWVLSFCREMPSGHAMSSARAASGVPEAPFGCAGWAIFRKF
jgi:hypothetical protein